MIDKATILLAATCFFSIPSPSHSAQLVVRGRPLYHIVVTPDTVAHERVPESKQDQFMLLITKERKSDDFVWASREDRQLIAIPSGTFTYFIAPTTGVVKVGDVRQMKDHLNALLPQLADMSPDGAAKVYWEKIFLTDPELRRANYAYVEILWQSFGVIIYYGIADEFDP